jgi:hypothetical protein
MRLGLAGCLKRSRDFAKQQTWELGIRSWWFHNEGFGQFLLENAICHLAALFFSGLQIHPAAWVETNYCQNNSLFMISEFVLRNGLLLSRSSMRLGLAGCLKRSRDFETNQTGASGFMARWFHNEGLGQFLLKNHWPESAICHLAALFFLAHDYIHSLGGNKLLWKQLFVHDSERNSSSEMGCFCHTT